MANIKAFGEDAPSGKRTVFNETTQSDDINTNLNDDYARGWEAIGDSAPSIQDINAVEYTQGYLTSYLYQQGVPEWSSEQGYLEFNMVNFEGKIYSCKTGDEANRCYNKNPKTELGYWREVGAEEKISPSNVGCSFSSKLSSQINDLSLNAGSYRFPTNLRSTRTKSDNGFSQIDGYKFYCPKKGVYFLRASLTFKFRLSGIALSDNQIQRLITYNNNEIVIFVNRYTLGVTTKFSILFSPNENLTYPVSVSGLVELNKGDYVSLAYSINSNFSGHATIVGGSLIGYKI